MSSCSCGATTAREQDRTGAVNPLVDPLSGRLWGRQLQALEYFQRELQQLRDERRRLGVLLQVRVAASCDAAPAVRHGAHLLPPRVVPRSMLDLEPADGRRARRVRGARSSWRVKGDTDNGSRRW